MGGRAHAGYQSAARFGSRRAYHYFLQTGARPLDPPAALAALIPRSIALDPGGLWLSAAQTAGDNFDPWPGPTRWRPVLQPTADSDTRTLAARARTAKCPHLPAHHGLLGSSRQASAGSVGFAGAPVPNALAARLYRAGVAADINAEPRDLHRLDG